MSNWKDTIPALDTDKIRDLANEFCFDPGVLATELHKIALGAFVVADAKGREPKQTDLKRKLKTIQNQAEALKVSIQEIGTTSSFHGKLFHQFTHLHMLETELSELAQVAKTFQPERKKKSDTVRNEIIITLCAKFWIKQTQKRDSYFLNPRSRLNPYNSGAGDFNEFLAGVASIMNVSPDTLLNRFKTLKQQDSDF